MQCGADTPSTVLHVRCRPDTAETSYRQVLDLLDDISPLVQALPPSAALVDVKGATKYHSRTPYQLAERIRLRALALLGIDTHIGIGSNYSLAAMASARPARNGLRLVEPADVTAFLAPLPIEALHGIGPVQARVLSRYGVHTVGTLAALPASTASRLLGGRAGRLLHERAHGIDSRPVTPKRLPQTVSERVRFASDTLNPHDQWAALLHLVTTLGAQLRAQKRAATAITVVVTFADQSTVSRTRRLQEASAHTVDLQTPAHRILHGFALQRARVREIACRLDLTDADRTAHQITLDATRESVLRLEPVVDRANARFGPGTVGPAAAYRQRTG